MMHQTELLTARRSIAMLIVIIVAAAAFRVALFRGYVGLDDGEYARLAHQFASGTFHLGSYGGPAVFPLRVGLTVPTAVLFRAFGVSEWTLVLYPLLLSLASIALAYACAASLFGRIAGLIAAATLAVFPWDLDNASTLLPDLPSAFFMAAAVTCVLVLERSSERRPSRLVGGGLLAGVLLGLSWLTKESVSYLAPFCALAAIVMIKRHGRPMLYLWAALAAGALAVLLGEMLVYRALTGDLLFRFHEVERNYIQNQKYFFAEGTDHGWTPGSSYTQAILHRVFVSGPAIILLNSTFLLVPLVGVVATLYAWWRRDAAFLLPGLWLWSLVLMFNFSSSSTASYVPLALYDRYLYPIFFPAIVIAAGFLARAIFTPRYGRWMSLVTPPRVTGLAVALCVAWLGGTQLLLNLRHFRSWNADVRAIRQDVTPDTATYADTLSLRALEFFAGYPASTAWVDFEAVKSADDIAAGSLVVINSPYISWLDRRGGIWGSRRSGYRQHDFYLRPPHQWTPVWRNQNVSLYRVPAPRQAQS